MPHAERKSKPDAGERDEGYSNYWANALGAPCVQVGRDRYSSSSKANWGKGKGRRFGKTRGGNERQFNVRKKKSVHGPVVIRV